MIYLTLEQVLFLHREIILKSGGGLGVRDLSALESAIARPQASFAGAELYPDIFSKAAAYVHSLILNHPFIDGNKRTALGCAYIFLGRNGRGLKMAKKEGVSFTLKILEERWEITKIARWLKNHAK